MTNMTEEIRAAHILVDTQARALEIVGWLDEAPRERLQEAFAELAARNSTCSSFQQGGDLGFFKRGVMHKTFEAIAFNLAPRQYNRIPVQTPFGWHIICRIA
jgi:peptidylprolyl isomerase/peptidyl-prolyl cis-trans isomerase C